MIPLTVRQVAEVTGLPVPDAGDPAVDDVVTSVEFDTRRVVPGALFVALAGQRVDGHDLAGAARAAGAVAVLGSRDLPPDAGLPLLRAADGTAVLDALAALARHSVTELVRATGLTVVGLTGSSGKTSTKDLVAAVLRAGVAGADPERGGSPVDPATAVVAPPESFNNELGHPYTVLRADASTRYLVLELSARGRGHIAALTRIARPRIGAVLNVGSAHLGEFGSVDAIAQAKGELVEALPSAAEGGVAVLNADDHRVLAMASRTAARVVTVGTGDADVRAEDVTVDDLARAGFRLVTPQGSAQVRLAVAGVHQVGNALSAAAVGLTVGMSPDAVAGALSAARPASRWRMEIRERPDGVTVINDAYNANPDSVRAALRSLATIGEHRRTVAVLGEMGELGDAARDAHDAIGRLAVRLGIDQVIAVGDGARALYLGAHLEGSWNGESRLVPDVDAAVAAVLETVRPGDVVLVKASRAVGLERVAQALLADGPGGDPAGDAGPPAAGDSA
ncbi:UDP-N-acetylmuramoyl-tripeptide--D-alanyl-D-alanine ligase [Nakamurella endophytica]|uniref:UDP-N-acetylmuramoyl-tripeptide--D-alanyl-D-alanine ligase n=1 Tax=Nakamurella endophytica TaxID=1748367 RepID=A0A917T6Z7_9ACTN|nr:UDP-N-acetylmuramoyl-tripeptide--D-alanyl-D-alanine ligase [Nakamurella endophytica]GGM11555.1 UDP-N-acetylmuramoyl-tripeptide--D-alanyl-D-alanine ligase [Nakamurella endophytica]